jgi:hypothetical protein
MNNLPDNMKCNMCPRGIMEKSRRGEFHQYYTCSSVKCKNTTGLPLTQYKESESSNDFGSGAFKSNREEI